MATPQITWDAPQAQQIKWDEPKRLGADQPDTNAMPESSVKEALPRSVMSLGRTIAGIPGGIYHAFSDEPSAEESSELMGHGLDPSSSLDRAGLRMVAKPLSTAASWYKDATTGKIPNAYEQALSVGPEAMGIGGAAVIAPKLTAAVPGAIASASDVVRGPIGDAVGAGLKEIPGAAIRRIPYVGKVAGDIYKAGAKAYRAPAPEQGAPLGRIPVRSKISTPIGAPEPAVESMHPAARTEWPPPEPPGPYDKVPPAPRGIKDTLDDQAVREEVQEGIARTDRKVFADTRVRNDVSTPKGVMHEQLREDRGEPPPPVKLTKTPIARAKPSGPRGISTGTPATDDLTPILERSVAAAKKAKGKKGD